MTAPARRLPLALLLALGCVLLGMPRATAASDPAPASLSGITVGADHVVTGVLTVRGGQAAATVDASSLRASIGERSYPVTTQPRSDQRRATMLVVDTSGSMGATGMAAVKSAVRTFLATVPPDVEVGLVSFAGAAAVDVPLTRDRGQVQAGVDRLQSFGETTLYDAVSLAVTTLGDSGERSIVVLSDGADTRSTRATKAQSTAALRSAGVRAQIIGFKTGYSDNVVLGEIAAAGQGSVARADDAAAVAGAFRSAAQAFDAQVRWIVSPGADAQGPQTLVMSGVASGAPFRAQAPVQLGAVPAQPASGTPASTATAPGATTPTADPAAPTADPAAPGAAPGPTGAAGSPAAPAAGATGAGDRTVLGLPMQVLLGAAALFLGLLGVVIALLAPMFRSRRKERVAAVEGYVSGVPRGSGARSSASSTSAVAESLVALGDRVMQGRESTSRTMLLLQRADLPWRAGEWWVMRIVGGVLGVAVGVVLLHGAALLTLAGAVVGLLLGLYAPSFVLRFLAKRRGTKFERQLPDVLTLVASSLSTGFSLLQAVDAVAHDAADPAAKEFARAVAETRIGSDVDEALERMAARMESTNMGWTAMAVRIQRQVGGNLAETLRTTATTLREREGLYRHVRALSAEGRLSAYILIALPIGIFLLTLQSNPDYISLLWSNLLGIAMMAFGVLAMVAGIFWMRKVVNVEV